MGERILREARLDRQVAEALKAIKRPGATALVHGARALFRRSRRSEWRVHIADIVKTLSKKIRIKAQPKGAKR